MDSGASFADVPIMNPRVKQFAIAGGIVIGSLVLLAIASKAIGRGEWFMAGVWSVVAVGVSTGVAWLLGDDLPEQAAQLRSGILAAGPLGVSVIVVVTIMYPAELTPAFMATEVTPGALNSRIERFEGRKVSITGSIRRDGRSSGVLVDDEGTVPVTARHANHETFALPESGSEVTAIGVVRGDSRGFELILSKVSVMSAPEAVAGY
jgi:hypothetical protein